MRTPPAETFSAPQAVGDARPRAPRRWLLRGTGLVAVALALLVWANRWHKPPRAATDPFALPPLEPSPFLNTSPEVGYVGSKACVACHKDECASFRCTGMGRSMATVDLAQEPSDGAFDHPASKRGYQIVRKAGALWHREWLLTDKPREVLLEEHPVKYVVGSGNHSRSYLYEEDGFLMESPVSWYKSRQSWGMSPGYDKPHQQGFMRAIGAGCLFCHAGQAEAVEKSAHRMHITEAALGCERCHGPGALHVERHTAGERGTGDVDYTIVNPSHLSRELSEAICQQCHLPATTSVPARGRDLTDFRPGRRLEDFWHVYQVAGKNTTMKVVGHVEQLHLSRCYQESKTLTCLTCHDPHDEEPADRRAAHYNGICLDCHQPERCTVNPVRRALESPDNNCVQCHMPRGDTDIPHFAFAHHRIGIHDQHPAAEDRPSGPGELRPFLPLSHLGDIDRKRSLGLAYLLQSTRESDAGREQRYERQALELLTAVRKAGLTDADVEAALAKLRSDLKEGDALSAAESALAQPGLTGQARCDALVVCARENANAGRHEVTEAALRELMRLRRHPLDRLNLAGCLQALGDEAGAQEALEEATRISPRLWNVHQNLAEFYRQQGDTKRADWHQQRAVP